MSMAAGAGYPPMPGASGGYPPMPAGQPMQQPGADRRPCGKPIAQDPLSKGGREKMKKQAINKANASTPRAQRVFQLTAWTLAPFCVFVLILFLTTYMFYKAPQMVLLTFTIVTGLCLMQYLLVEYCIRKKAGRWKKWIGGFSATAAFVALCVGLLIHYKYTLFYYKYSSMMRYTNVAPLQPALQFEDAGSLHFTAGTTVDRTRSVGYRHIRSSQTLCVAPVVSGQMAPTDPIVFFAVGTNCCGWRASFHCDDVGSGDARGGLLMLTPDQLVSPSMEWMVDEQFDFKAFEDAIALQSSVFTVNAAKHHRFLRWVKDPDAMIDHYRKRGLESALLSCLGYWIVVAVCISYHLAIENERAKRKAEFLQKGGSIAEA